MSRYIKLNEPHFDSAVKCLLIGDAGVGKSSILERYVNNTFVNNNLSTVGVDYFTKYVRLENCVIKLQIWDLAGQMNYRNIIHSYYRNAEILFYVFDKGSRESFNHFEKWIEDFKDRLFEIHIVIVGNKCDVEYRGVPKVSPPEGDLTLASNAGSIVSEVSSANFGTIRYPCVSSEEAIDLANKYEAQYYETSAKDNINIREIFENTVQLLHDRKLIKYRKNNIDDKIVLTGNNNSRYNCCSGTV
jgi:Ras-related protein Rab-3C